jgi:hypothetical protein
MSCNLIFHSNQNLGFPVQSNGSSLLQRNVNYWWTPQIAEPRGRLANTPLPEQVKLHQTKSLEHIGGSRRMALLLLDLSTKYR